MGEWRRHQIRRTVILLIDIPSSMENAMRLQLYYGPDDRNVGNECDRPSRRPPVNPGSSSSSRYGPVRGFHARPALSSAQLDIRRSPDLSFPTMGLGKTGARTTIRPAPQKTKCSYFL